MRRCPYCHRAIIPQRIRKILKKKFGKEEPHYKNKCKECGKPFGEHIGTSCPPKIKRTFLKGT